VESSNSNGIQKRRSYELIVLIQTDSDAIMSFDVFRAYSKLQESTEELLPLALSSGGSILLVHLLAASKKNIMRAYLCKDRRLGPSCCPRISRHPI